MRDSASRSLRVFTRRASVQPMTTLVDEGEALVVRCDVCRRLWPVSRSRLESPVWTLDEAYDLHRCPVCTVPPAGAMDRAAPADVD